MTVKPSPPAEDTAAVRLAAEALRHLAADPGRFAAFRQEILDRGGSAPLGLDRAVIEMLTPRTLAGAREQFTLAMIAAGYE